MSPVGEGESGTPGPLFPRLFPLGHLARAGPGSPALAVFDSYNTFGDRTKSRSVAYLLISGVGHLKLHLGFLTMAIFLLPTYFLAHLLALSWLRSALFRSVPVSVPRFRRP